MPDQDGRVAVVTGANTGLGLETSRELARAGAKVVLAVRDTGKGQAAVDDVGLDAPDADLELVELDLSSLDSIRTAAAELGERLDRIDLLINNAGVMFTPRRATADGFELQFGTNHLGHFAFTGLVLHQLLSVPGSRVVTVSSIAHRMQSKLDFDDLNAERRYNPAAAYGRSKLSNLLFTYELQRRLASTDGAETIALAAHPGVSTTELSRHLPMADAFMPMMSWMFQSAAMGALPTLRAATDPNAEGGQYYGPGGFMELRGHPERVMSSRRSHDAEVQRRLWSVSEDLTGVTFSV